MMDDQFQRVGDAMNLKFQQCFQREFVKLGKKWPNPDDASVLVVATLAGAISAIGYVAASFDQHIDNDLLGSIVREQFDAGRADFHDKNRTGEVMQ